MEHSYERLRVWQTARQLVKAIYELAALFPVNERYGLSDQIRRAAVSVASNLAEGSGRTSRKEKAHFCEIAYGSLMEVSCQLVLAIDLGFLTCAETCHAQALIDDLAIRLCAFRNHLLKIPNPFA